MSYARKQNGTGFYETQNSQISYCTCRCGLRNGSTMHSTSSAVAWLVRRSILPHVTWLDFDQSRLRICEQYTENIFELAFTHSRGK